MTEPAHREDPGTPDAAKPDIPDYTLLRRIGRGSYGDVWLARSVTGVFRVIKVVQRSRFEDDRPYLRELEGISRFQAAVSGRPRQLALLHVGRNDEAGYFYYVMEPADDAESGSAIDPDRYVPLTLREMVRRRGRLPAHECVEFTLELARGLAVLHGENLIHRDIKPSNVIFVQRTPKLADVGLVASADATLTGVGTPGYLPPEGPGSVTADIYSLGKVLYQIATGMDQSQYPRIPRELATHPDAPLLREINSIVLKACSPYPAQRHPSADILARDLELIQAGRSVAFYEEFRKRSRRILAITASLALVAGLAAALFVWRSQVLQRANEQTRRALYRSDLAVAQLARTSGDLGRARSALARQIPQEGESDLRGIEWSILAEAVRGEGAPLEPVPNPVAVTKIAADPNGRWVAASLTDDRVAVWDLHNGRIERIIPNARVLGGFLPDSQIVIDEPERAIRYESPNEGAKLSIPTGQRLYSMLPNGSLLVVTPEGDVVFSLLAPTTGQTIGKFNLSSIGTNLVNSSQDVSPDGKTIVIGAYQDDGAIRDRILLAADLQSGKKLWSYHPHARIVWIKWSPLGNLVSVNIGGLGPSLIEPDTGRVIFTLAGHTARVQDACFSSDGRFIATAGADQTVRVWNTKSGELLSVHRGLGRPATAVGWLSDSKHVVAADDSGSLRVFDLQKDLTADVTDGLFDDLHGDLAFSPDSQFIAVTKNTNEIGIVSFRDSTLVRTIPNLFQPVAFSKNGTQIIAFSSDWSLWRYHLTSEVSESIELRLPRGFSVDGWSICHDSSLTAFSGNGGEIVILNLEAKYSLPVENAPTNRVWALAFTPDGNELLAGSERGTIKRWRTSDGHELGGIAKIDGDTQALAMSPNGRWLAVSLFNDASIRVWDCSKHLWLPGLYAHRRYVQSLLFSPSGDRLISGGVDGRVIVWRVPDFEEIASFEVSAARKSDGDEGIAALKLGPNASGIAALTEDGRLQVWRAKVP